MEKKIIAAAVNTRADGWWWNDVSPKAMNLNIVKEMAQASICEPLYEFYHAIMEQKEIDHFASHSHLINQFLHLISSSIFIW